MNTLNATKHTDLQVSQEWPYTLSQGNPAIAWMYPPLKHIQDQSGLGSVHSNPAVVFSVPCREVGSDGLLRPFELNSISLWFYEVGLTRAPHWLPRHRGHLPIPCAAVVKGKQRIKLQKAFFFFFWLFGFISRGWTTSDAKWKQGRLEHTDVTPDLEHSNS